MHLDVWEHSFLNNFQVMLADRGLETTDLIHGILEKTSIKEWTVIIKWPIGGEEDRAYLT